MSNRPRIVRLAEIKNIVGVKEASGNISQMASILRASLSRSSFFPATIPSLCRSSHLAGRVSSQWFRMKSRASLPHSHKPRCKGDFARARAIAEEVSSSDGNQFCRNQPWPCEIRDVAHGLLRAGLAAAHGRAHARQPAESGSRSRISWSARGSARLSDSLRQSIEVLFDQKPTQYTDEHQKLFAEFLALLNQRRRSRGRTRCHSAHWLARECVGQEGHLAGLSHRRHCRDVRPVL